MNAVPAVNTRSGLGSIVYGLGSRIFTPGDRVRISVELLSEVGFLKLLLQF